MNPDTASIRLRFKQRESFLAGGIATLLLIGVPMLFIGPLALASLFWFATLNLFGYYPWTWFFWGFVVILIPLLFWTERRTRGGFLADTVIEAGGGSELPYLLGGDLGLLISFATNPRVTMSGFIEIFLTGPRFVLDAFEKMNRARRVRSVDQDRAAAIVADLLRTDRGVPIQSLVRPGERLATLDVSLAYLLFFDWIGLSKDRSRVWILTEARQRLS
jgi:hypothetical protein